jgi:hypothetical protein
MANVAAMCSHSRAEQLRASSVILHSSQSVDKYGVQFSGYFEEKKKGPKIQKRAQWLS